MPQSGCSRITGSVIMKVAVFAAFPQELKHIPKESVLAGRRAEGTVPLWRSRYHGAELIIAETGMNAAHMAAAFWQVLREHRPQVALSIGFGGALYRQSEIGDLVIPTRYFLYSPEGLIELEHLGRRNAELEQSLWSGSVMDRLRQKLPVKAGSFITLPHWIAKEKLKATLPAGVPLPVCDRETVHLARLAHSSTIPFFAIRAITDRADEDIPEELFRVVDDRGRYRLSLALGVLLSRPCLMPDAVRLGRHAVRASRRLWSAVKAFVEAAGSNRMTINRLLNDVLRRQRMRAGAIKGYSP